MTAAHVTNDTQTHRRFVRLLPAGWLIATVLLLLASIQLARNAFVSRDLADLLNAHGGTIADGAWLSALVLDAAALLPPMWAQGVLALVSSAVAGLLIGILFRDLRRNAWPLWQCALLVTLFAGHALVLYAITAAVSVVPLLLTCAAIVPAVRRLESVGDVQAEMGFGLVLPLFLLAGPEMAPLIPALAAGSAFFDPIARKDIRAFIAMFLVAILPSLIVLAGLIGVHIQRGGAVGDFLALYTMPFAHIANAGWREVFTDLAVFAPVAMLPLVYCAVPDRRMQPISALAVLAFPLYLALGIGFFGWRIDPWAPAAALLAALFAWLSVARLKPSLRSAAMALVAAGAIASWTQPQLWTDAAWKQALWHWRMPIHMIQGGADANTRAAARYTSSIIRESFSR